MKASKIDWSASVVLKALFLVQLSDMAARKKKDGLSACAYASHMKDSDGG